MAGELNTEVRDDSAACRVMAAWLQKLSAGVEQIGDVVIQQRGASESFWQGSAGNACRAELETERRDSDSLEQLIDTTRRALNAFADQLDTVRARMDQARQVARDAGLIVVPNAVLPPGPGPGAMPTHPTGPMAPDAERRYSEQLNIYSAALERHQAKQAAFAEVANTVADARGRQEGAHSALDKAMQDPLAEIKSLKTVEMFMFSTGLSAAKARQTWAYDLLKQAEGIEEHGNRMQAIADDPRNPAATRATAERVAQTSSMGAEYTKAQGEKIQLNTPEWVRKGVEANPGNYIKDGTGWLKLGKNAARAVPFLGTTVTIASGAGDIALGKDPGVAAAETGGNLAGGVAGSLAGAELGGAVGSMIFPGPGTTVGGVIGGVAGGVIGGMSGTQAADEVMGVED